MTKSQYASFRKDVLTNFAILAIAIIGLILSVVQYIKGNNSVVFIGISAAMTVYSIIYFRRLEGKIKKQNLESYHACLSRYDSLLEMDVDAFKKIRLKNLYDYSTLLQSAFHYYRVKENSFGLKYEIKTELPIHGANKIAQQTETLFQMPYVRIKETAGNKIEAISIFTEVYRVFIEPDKITVLKDNKPLEQKEAHTFLKESKALYPEIS